MSFLVWAALSWHFNFDGGFGFYQPSGWTVTSNGRSSALTGPGRDSAQSELFVGSDWVDSVQTLSDLKTHAERETGQTVTQAKISSLDGFCAGSDVEAECFVLRFPKNVLVLRYFLRGSSAQIFEGKTVLSSIEIRTEGIENYLAQ